MEPNRHIQSDTEDEFQHCAIGLISFFELSAVLIEFNKIYAIEPNSLLL